jgi:hypothetical protein
MAIYEDLTATWNLSKSTITPLKKYDGNVSRLALKLFITEN